MPIPKQHLTRPPFPLLVTGVAGVTGYNAFKYFSQLFPGQVIGTRRRDNWPLRGEGIVGCDMHNRNDLVRLANDHDFQSVVYCDSVLGEEEGRDRALYVRFLARRLVQEEASASH